MKNWLKTVETKVLLQAHICSRGAHHDWAGFADHKSFKPACLFNHCCGSGDTQIIPTLTAQRRVTVGGDEAAPARIISTALWTLSRPERGAIQTSSHSTGNPSSMLPVVAGCHAG